MNYKGGVLLESMDYKGGGLLESMDYKGAVAHGVSRSIKFSQIFYVCFIVFLHMSAGCVSTFRTCVQGYLEWLPFVFCCLPSFHAL